MKRWGITALTFPQGIVYASLFCAGVFYEYLSCALSVILLCWLTVRLYRRGTLAVHVTWMSVAVLVLSVSYLVTALWAVDGGDAVLGFFKFLPLPLYLLVLMQEEGAATRVIDGLPYAVTAVAVVSVIGSYLPWCRSFFLVSGRLAGTLQYPNTFAVVLLVALLLLISKDVVRVWDFGCMAVLCFSLLYTGSRAVFVLAIPAVLVTLLMNRRRAVRVAVLYGGGAALVLGVAVCLLTGNAHLLTRLATLSLNESTFVGRLLYAQDALPVVLRHPFGIGYLGWYYTQYGIQTGAYNVMYLHNDILQFLLDVGWIPSLALVVAVVRSVFSKAVVSRYKPIIVMMLLHACFDFDWQYIGVLLLFLTFTVSPPLKTWQLRRHGLAVTVSAVTAAMCVYVGLAALLFSLGQVRAVDAFYPFHTRNDIALLKLADTDEAMNARADRILQRNDHVALAHSAKARLAFSQGDFAQVMAHKTRVLELARYDNEEYQEYAVMLIQGIALYQQAGDGQSAEICAVELLRIPRKMRAAMNAQSDLGKRISLQPHLALSEDVQQYIDSIQ